MHTLLTARVTFLASLNNYHTRILGKDKVRQEYKITTVEECILIEHDFIVYDVIDFVLLVIPGDNFFSAEL